MCGRWRPIRCRRLAGVIGVNRVVDGAAAAEMAKLFVEAIVAPDFTAEALEKFGAKKNLRLLKIVPARGDAGGEADLGRVPVAG